MIRTLDAAELARHRLPRLPHDGDKEDRGSVLVIGGDIDMAGAVLLAGLAALRVGAGKLQLRSDRPSAAALSVAVPEARILIAAPGAVAPLAGAARRSTALVIGPGMMEGPRRRRVALRLLAAAPDARVVIDAGALPEAKGRTVGFAALAAGRAVLTPHAGEMAALLGRSKDAVRADPLAAAREAAAALASVVVMKGATTHIVSPDGAAWRHDGGVTGLATSGSGDVLAGVIGGLLARGASPTTAALWGVRTHAMAGLALSSAIAPLGFLARELLDLLPRCIARADAAD